MALYVGGSPITPAQLATLQADLGIVVAGEIVNRLTSLVSTDDTIFLRNGVPYLGAASIIADYVGVSGGAQTLTPARFNNAQTFYGPTVSSAGNLIASRYDNAQAFYGPTVTRGAVTLTAARYDNGQTFYGPTVAVPSAGADYIAVETAAGNVTTTGLTANAPAGTASGDTLVAFVSNIWNGITLLPPDGWNSRGSIYSPAQNTGIEVYTAPGSVSDFNWQTSSGTSFGVHISVLRLSGINNTTPIRGIQTLFDDSSSANVPAPAVTATAGDVIISALLQNQSANAFGTPESGYSRVVEYNTGNGVSVLVQEGAAGGSTGTISHATSIAFQARVMVSIALAAA